MNVISVWYLRTLNLTHKTESINVYHLQHLFSRVGCSKIYFCTRRVFDTDIRIKENATCFVLRFFLQKQKREARKIYPKRSASESESNKHRGMYHLYIHYIFNVFRGSMTASMDWSDERLYTSSCYDRNRYWKTY